MIFKRHVYDETMFCYVGLAGPGWMNGALGNTDKIRKGPNIVTHRNGRELESEILETDETCRFAF